MEKERCPNCQREMKVDKYINATTIKTKCKYCNKIFKIIYDEAKIPNNINNFNWGAFGLWHLWGFWNGMPILSCFGLLLGFIVNVVYPLLIIDIAIALFLGIRGNRLSWERKEWSSTTIFETCQKEWNIATAVLLCLVTVLGFLLGLIISFN